MRLTKKTGYFNENPIYSVLAEPKEVFVELNKSVQKLGQLEDIEEELGINLFTVFKALKDVVYEKEGHSAEKSIRFIPNDCLVFDDEFLYELKYCKGYTKLVRHLYLEDYGKTLALTKEELENGK